MRYPDGMQTVECRVHKQPQAACMSTDACRPSPTHWEAEDAQRRHSVLGPDGGMHGEDTLSLVKDQERIGMHRGAVQACL